jgi:hypothetical protein
MPIFVFKKIAQIIRVNLWRLHRLLRWLVSRGWDVALGKPRLKLRVLSRAGQAAFAVVVNASVDGLTIFVGG